MNILDKVDAAYLRDDIPEFRAGDTVEVDVKIVEGKTERIQVCLLYTSPSPRDGLLSRMPSSA